MKALALALALYWPLALAQEADDRIICREGRCMITEKDLRMLLSAYRELAQHAAQLRALCGWEPKP